jgi:pyruvate dehydrogenase complex dehydrogenase (E1) component
MAAAVEQAPGSPPADPDSQETQEWLDALESVIYHTGQPRGIFLVEQLAQRLRNSGADVRVPFHSPYRNTLGLDQQAAHPGNIALEERITAILRWNALAMVVGANKAYGELGGHVASYASAAETIASPLLRHRDRPSTAWSPRPGWRSIPNGTTCPGSLGKPE